MNAGPSTEIITQKKMASQGFEPVTFRIILPSSRYLSLKLELQSEFTKVASTLVINSPSTPVQAQILTRTHSTMCFFLLLSIFWRYLKFPPPTPLSKSLSCFEAETEQKRVFARKWAVKFLPIKSDASLLIAFQLKLFFAVSRFSKFRNIVCRDGNEIVAWSKFQP